MPLLNPFLRAFFRSHFVSQCSPVHDHILLVPTTEILTTARDRESGISYAELASNDEFLGSHVLRIPSSEYGDGGIGPMAGRESRAKARQYTTINGRTVVIKDSWIYSNKGFRSLSQAQLLNDVCYYPDALEPQQWLIYVISRPLIGSLEPIQIPIAQISGRVSESEVATEKNDLVSVSSSFTSASTRKRSIQSFSELLLLFPMVAQHMQLGLDKIIHNFSASFEKPLPPSPPPSAVPSVSSAASSSLTDNGETNAVSFVSLASPNNEYRNLRSEADEPIIRKALEIAVASAIELFQRIDQSQLSLLASSTDLTGTIVERLIERYIAEQLHDPVLFPRVCATKKVEDDELDKRIKSMENVDLTQIGIPFLDQRAKVGLAKRITKAIEAFQKLTSAKSPLSMTEILLETAQALTKLPSLQLSDTGLDGEKAEYGDTNTTIATMNADMLVSLLLIVVIRSRVPYLAARLSYMKNYVFVDDVEAGEMGYVLSTLEAVLYHITQESDHLSLASSKNKELWKYVRKGNLGGLKGLLEPQESGSKVESDDAASDVTPETIADAEIPQDDENIKIENGMSSPKLTSEEIQCFDVSGEIESTSVKSEKQPNDLKKPEAESTGNATSYVPQVSDGKAEVSSEETGSAGSAGNQHLQNGRIPPLGETNELRGLQGSLFLHPSNESRASPEVPGNEESEVDAGIFRNMSHFHSQDRMSRAAEFDDALLDGDENRSLKRLPKTTSVISLATTIRDANSLGQLSRTLSTTSQAKDLNSLEKLSKTRNSNGDSILMMATQERQAGILRYLLDSAYFPTKFVLDDENNEGTTLLSAAVQHQDASVMEVLMDLLLKIPVRELREYLQRTDNAGRTAAHYLFHYPDLIEKLGRYLPWRQRDKNGQTPLCALCRSYDHPKYFDMVKTAIKVAQDAQGDGEPLHLDDHVDSKGNTLLHIAGDQAILKLLLRCDAEVNAVNDKGFTPLMLASKYGRVDSVRTFFGDQRVDILAKELRGLTAVELAKDDDVRNRIDDMVLFQNAPLKDGRVTAVVRSFFVEDATIRFVVKSAAPSGQTTLTVTTCRRSLTDFEFLAHWLSYEHPASWLPTLQNDRSPFQIPSKPSRAVLREIQLKVDFFLRTLLAHPTFSTHELLWEFFLVPDIQTEQMMERSRRKVENRAEKIKEEYTPVEDTKEVELFVTHAKDTVRSITFAFRSVIRRVTAVRSNIADLADTYKLGFKLFSNQITFLPPAYPAALLKFAEAQTPNESHPLTIFISDLRNIQASLTGVMAALDRPRVIIEEMANVQKKVDRHLASLRRSDRWPLGLLDETRQKYHEEAAENVGRAREEFLGKASELRYTHTVAAAELAAYHEMHEGMVKRAVKNLVSRSLVVERARLESMRRAMRELGVERRKMGDKKRDKDKGKGREILW